ncbi:hypothetical protein J2794_006611 [Paraburkholderia terricola]|nr:hypothetical protein [Paraburkholderia terricola]
MNEYGWLISTIRVMTAYAAHGTQLFRRGRLQREKEERHGYHGVCANPARQPWYLGM